VPPVWSSPVRFVECDQQGVVFNAHYLTWADEAVNAWWVGRGVRWEELARRGLEHLVVASSLQWRSSARWGDTVLVDADLDALGRTSLAVRFVVRVGDRVCCEIRTTYVCTLDGASTPWPDEVRALLTEA
jgi:acyl-CoA thioester hydrolase